MSKSDQRTELLALGDEIRQNLERQMSERAQWVGEASALRDVGVGHPKELIEDVLQVIVFKGCVLKYSLAAVCAS